MTTPAHQEFRNEIREKLRKGALRHSLDLTLVQLEALVSFVLYCAEAEGMRADQVCAVIATTLAVMHIEK
jgi:hypothetical protein